MGRIVITGLSMAALWLLLSGYFDHPLLLVLGTASVILSVYLAHRAGMLDEEGVPGGIFPGILAYMFWLTFEIGKSNIAVAREALAIKPNLSPRLFRVPVPTRSNVGKVIYANSITLTPGTVSIDLSEGSILVHGLTEDLSDEDAIVDMGQRVAKTETGEEG